MVDSVYVYSCYQIFYKQIICMKNRWLQHHFRSLRYHFLLKILPLQCGTGQCSRYSNSLWAGRSGDQIPVGARFSAPVQISSGANPASYTMDTRSFPGVKQPGHGVDHPPPSSAEVKERVELYLYSASGPSWPVIGWTLPLCLPLPLQ